MLLELGTDSRRSIWRNSVVLVRLLFLMSHLAVSRLTLIHLRRNSKQHSLDTNHPVSKAFGSEVTGKLITILRP